MPIRDVQQTNKQHAVPQNIMDVEFKIIGDLTLRQFLYLLVFGGSAYLTGIFTRGIFRWPLTAFLAILGIGLAFIPLAERGMDQWIISFLKAVYSPTKKIWKKDPVMPAAFMYQHMDVVKQEMITLAPTSSRRKLEEFLERESSMAKPDKLDIPEADYANMVKNAFKSGGKGSLQNYYSTSASPSVTTTEQDLEKIFAPKERVPVYMHPSPSVEQNAPVRTPEPPRPPEPVKSPETPVPVKAAPPPAPKEVHEDKKPEPSKTFSSLINPFKKPAAEPQKQPEPIAPPRVMPTPETPKPQFPTRTENPVPPTFKPAQPAMSPMQKTQPVQPQPEQRYIPPVKPAFPPEPPKQPVPPVQVPPQPAVIPNVTAQPAPAPVPQPVVATPPPPIPEPKLQTTVVRPLEQPSLAHSEIRKPKLRLSLPLNREGEGTGIYPMTPDRRAGRSFTSLLPRQGEIILPVRGEKVLKTSEEIRVEEGIEEKTAQLNQLIAQIKQDQSYKKLMNKQQKYQNTPPTEVAPPPPPKNKKEELNQKQAEVQNIADSFQKETERLQAEITRLKNELDQSSGMDTQKDMETRKRMEILEIRKAHNQQEFENLQHKISELELKLQQKERIVPTIFEKPAPQPKVAPVKASYSKSVPTPDKPNVISGEVKDSSGKGLEGVVLVLRNTRGETVRAIKTNALGQFSLVSPLANGLYNIETDQFHKSGLVFDIISVEVKGEVISPIEFIGR